ncbi:MAG: YdeI/OmpD-associated family protein [Actinomycetota bacterium]
MPDEQPRARFFKDAAGFRAWLEKNHATEKELFVGLYKVRTKHKGITYPEARDEALCFGWIDGRSGPVDDDRWMVRFTPRQPGSIWSQINIGRFDALRKEGRMTPAGEKAFNVRDRAKVERYSYERENARFDSASLKRFKADRRAWKFFEAQPASYKKMVTWWVVSAKRDETRARRLATLIEDSHNGLLIAQMREQERR